MLIGVDICNTISNINYELLQKFNINLKQYPAKEVPKDYFISSAGLKMFMDARPFNGAAATLNLLNKSGFRIMYITSRPIISCFVTKRWLQYNGFPKGPVEFVLSSEKAKVARDYGITMFFEDDPAVIKMLVKNKMPVFVKSAPYNRNLVGLGIIKFNEWAEIDSQLEFFPRVKI